MRGLVAVSWQEAEDALIGAFEYLGALPDRERGLLAGGEGRGMSAWPAFNLAGREQQGHMADDRPPRVRVGKREMALLEAMLLGRRACALAVPAGQRAFVGRVIVMKRWQSPGGFEWSEVWQREGGKRCGVTSDALRKRYDRAISRLAAAMESAGLVGAELPVVAG